MARRTKQVEALIHEEASRRNILTAEYQALRGSDVRSPVPVAYERRNRDLEPQLVWRGKEEQGWSGLVVSRPPCRDVAQSCGAGPRPRIGAQCRRGLGENEPSAQWYILTGLAVEGASQ